MPDNIKKNVSKTKVDYYADLKKLNNDSKKTIPNNQLPFDKQNKTIPKISSTKKEDSNLENIVEIIDPTGITSWDDISRSYKKEGLSGNTLLEIAGAIPFLGKIGKATKAGIHLKKYSGLDKSLYKTLPKNNILSNTTKTTAITGRATDAYQAGEQIYNQYQNGGIMNKPKNIPTWNYPSPGTKIHPTQSVPFALGGRMYNQGGSMEQLTEFGNGGSHEENMMGGIPQGTNAQGQMNLVEEGETKLNSKDYIFSDSLKVDKETAQAFGLPSSSNGKTFAEVSKGINSKNSFRKNDTIDNNHKTKLLDGLMEAQEAYKMKQAMIKMQELQALLPQGMSNMGQFMQPQGMEQQMPQEQPMEQPMEGQEQMPQEMPTIEQMRYGGNMYPDGGPLQFNGGQNLSGNWANTQDLSSGQNNLITPGTQPQGYTIDPNQAGSNYGMSSASEGMNPTTNNQGIQSNSLGLGKIIGAVGAGVGSYAASPQDGTMKSKSEAWDNAASSTAMAINPIVGGVWKAGSMVGNNLRAKTESTNSAGQLNNPNRARRDAIGGSFFNPLTAATTRAQYEGGWTDFTGKKYIQALQKENQANRQFYNNGGYLDSVQFDNGGPLTNEEFLKQKYSRGFYPTETGMYPGSLEDKLLSGDYTRFSHKVNIDNLNDASLQEEATLSMILNDEFEKKKLLDAYGDYKTFEEIKTSANLKDWNKNPELNKIVYKYLANPLGNIAVNTGNEVNDKKTKAYLMSKGIAESRIIIGSDSKKLAYEKTLKDIDNSFPFSKQYGNTLPEKMINDSIGGYSKNDPRLSKNNNVVPTPNASTQNQAGVVTNKTITPTKDLIYSEESPNGITQQELDNLTQSITNVPPVAATTPVVNNNTITENNTPVTNTNPQGSNTNTNTATISTPINSIPYKPIVTNDAYNIAIPQGRNSQESIFAYSPEEQAVLKTIYEQNPDLTDAEVQQLFPQGLKNVSPEQALDVVDNYTESSRLGSNNTNPGEAGRINTDTKETFILPDGSPTIDAPIKKDANGNVIMPTVQDVEADLATYDANGNIVWIPEQSKKLDDTQGVNLEGNKYNQIGQMVPVAYNTAMGIGTMFQKPTQLSYEDYMNNSKLNAAKMNIQEPLRDVDRDFTTTQKAIKAGSSGGQYLAMLNNLNNQAAKQRANLYNTKENFDNQMQMDADKFNIGLEGQNKAQRFQIDDWNARSKATKQAMTNQYLGAAATQVGQIARANREDQLGIEYAKLAGPDVSKGIDSYNPYWFNMKPKKK